MEKEDLMSMLSLSAAAKASGFKFNIWVDNDKNFTKTLEAVLKKMHAQDLATNAQQLCKIFGINIKNIDELKKRMIGENADAFYRGKDSHFPQARTLAKDIWHFINLERIGSKNLAAAADLLRYEILRQDGGYYIDTDVRFDGLSPNSPTDEPKERPAHNDNNENNRVEDPLDEQTNLLSLLKHPRKLIREHLRYGFKANLKPTYSIEDDDTVNIRDWLPNNDIIVAIRNHSILRESLILAIKQYHVMKKKIVKDNDPICFKLFSGGTVMDAKRFPYDGVTNPIIANSKLSLTLYASGPSILERALRAFWDRQKDHSVSSFGTLTLRTFNDYSCYIYTILGIPITLYTKSRWLTQKSKNIRGYEVSDIPSIVSQSRSLT